MYIGDIHISHTMYDYGFLFTLLKV